MIMRSLLLDVLCSAGKFGRSEGFDHPQQRFQFCQINTVAASEAVETLAVEIAGFFDSDIERPLACSAFAFATLQQLAMVMGDLGTEFREPLFVTLHHHSQGALSDGRLR
ncbi:MAG: hypothetical protein OQJ99_04015 [Rhodospirillales bacterium]|nr:hypothetical protein [Rhodospirillales bacterium]MCW8862576.1 hypothetical protein [Rhodospirillales bacterium]MCW8970725.1 hypothetical protein [Rhodospirillales bacterium]